MENRTALLLKIQGLLFLGFLLISFYFNRFAADDYYFIAKTSSETFAEAYIDLYLNWHGRWSSNFFLLLLIKAYSIPWFLFMVNLLSFGLVYFPVVALLKTMNRDYKLGLSNSLVRWYGLAFMTVFFFCNPNPSETWFWYTASVVYFWSISAFAFALNFMLKDESNWVSKALLALSLLFIGGANEPMSLMMLLGFLFLLFRGYKRTKSTLALLILLASFLVNYLSDGTTHRDEITPGLGFFDTVIYTGYAMVKYLFFDFYKSFQIAVLMAIPFYVLGKTTKVNIGFHPTKTIIYVILAIGTIVFMNALFGVVALGSIPPDRSMILSSFFIAGFCCWVCFGLGNYSKSSKKVVFFLPLISSIYLVFFTLHFAIVHKEYASAVDKRIESIVRSDDTIISVEALPPSGYLYSAEITTDPEHHKNAHLMNGLSLEKSVVLDTTSRTLN